MQAAATAHPRRIFMSETLQSSADAARLWQNARAGAVPSMRERDRGSHLAPPILSATGPPASVSVPAEPVNRDEPPIGAPLLPCATAPVARVRRNGAPLPCHR